ncbi:MAG: peptidylprolyl isomerase [Rhodospirillales bacterium]
MNRALFFVLLLAFLTKGGASAQDSLRIAAVVNEQIISVYDLNMRLSLVMAFAGLPDTVDNRQRLAPQVLRTLIDDELKRQEAVRQKLSVTETDIQRAIRRLERMNGVKEGELETLLARRKIEKKTLTRQIEAEMLWGRLVGSTFGPSVQVSDEEIDELLAEIEKNKGKPEFLVSEIFLPVDRSANEADVLALANRLIEQMKEGASFAALARNFSKSATADHGGDLGWNVHGQLGPYLDATVVNLQPGQTSAPIRAADGYYILRLRDRRTAASIGGEKRQSPIVNVQQFFLPIEKGASPAEVATATDAAKRVVEKAKTCEELDKASKEIGSPMSGNLGNIPTDALAPQQRSLIRALPLMTPSQPLRTEDGVIVLMVCRRDELKSETPSEAGIRTRISDRLVEERLDLAARQYLRDLRRNAFVDIRL